MPKHSNDPGKAQGPAAYDIRRLQMMQFAQAQRLSREHRIRTRTDVFQDQPASNDELTVAAVMVYARRNGRSCPVAPAWAAFHADLAAALTTHPASAPPPPLTSAAGRPSSLLSKRLRLREQLEWAAQHGLLGSAYAWLRSLQEDEWVHFSDEGADA